eukprot:scaffold3311_cov66-Skeletonema_marinoi.AAC.1
MMKSSTYPYPQMMVKIVMKKNPHRNCYRTTQLGIPFGETLVLNLTLVMCQHPNFHFNPLTPLSKTQKFPRVRPQYKT